MCLPLRNLNKYKQVLTLLLFVYFVYAWPSRVVVVCLLINLFLFINYNTTTNYIVIIYVPSNFDHVLGVETQTRHSGGNRTHNPHANNLAH